MHKINILRMLIPLPPKQDLSGLVVLRLVWFCRILPDQYVFWLHACSLVSQTNSKLWGRLRSLTISLLLGSALSLCNALCQCLASCSMYYCMLQDWRTSKDKYLIDWLILSMYTWQNFDNNIRVHEAAGAQSRYKI